MALLTIHDENRSTTDPDEISAYLEPHGIWYERWDVDGRLSHTATNDEILTAFAAEIERLKERGGFVTADVINVNSQTPNLDALLAKFAKEHTHSEDEVRFTVRGKGVFQIHPKEGPVFGVTVERGDLINVPAGTLHWFDLCQEREICCIRLFQNTSGWTPNYVENGVHDNYAPVCFGPSYLKRESQWRSPVNL